MKPSEWIHKRVNDILATLPVFQPLTEARVEGARLQALYDYLDEQHERSERREKVRDALAMIGPGCKAQHVNAALEQAGLDVRVPVGLRLHQARELIVQAAREKGVM